MGEYGLLDALHLYESFHLVQRQASWSQPGKDGKPDEGFPWGCLCLQCQKWTLCEHTALVESLFRADIELPDNLVAETPSLLKKCNKLRGTAGPCRARILKEIAKERKKSTSKIGFVDEPVPPQPDPPQLAPVPSESTRDASPPPAARFNVPSPNLPSSSEDEADPCQPADPRPASSRTSARSTASQLIPKLSDKEVQLDSDSDWLVLMTRPGRPAVTLSNRDGDAGSAPLPPCSGPLQNRPLVSPWRNRQTKRYTWTRTHTSCY